MQEPLPKDFEKYVKEEGDEVWTIKDGAPPDVVKVYNELYANRHLLKAKYEKLGLI